MQITDIKELKNQILTLKCVDLGNNFEGICKHQGITIFVNGALPQETIKIRVEKVEKQFAYGKLLEVIDKSEYRIEPKCQYFGDCGGCSCQHLQYHQTLRYKANIVKNCLKSIAKIDIDVPQTLGLDNPFASRNKCSLPVRDNNGNIDIGFYKKRSHNIINIDYCPISMVKIDSIIKIVKDWMISNSIKAYDEKTNIGLLRHLIIRNTSKGEIMLVLVCNGKYISNTKELINSLKNEVQGFVALYQNVNYNKNNVIMGNKNKLIYGSETISEAIFNNVFEISPVSFMQVNPQQTINLYQHAIKMASLNKQDICIDAYCGVGTISLIVAKYVKSIIGIEIVKDAVDNARQNANKNNIDNASFVHGAVEVELPKLIKLGILPSLVILDPPRKGLEPQVVKVLMESKVKKLIYISCNPATQARDISLLCEGGYSLEQVQPVDMFCMSSELENIALLKYSAN